jgi:succinate dehydrogenase hydrophobic anchor subunit
MGWRAELSKNWRARASAVLLVLAIIVLIDEVVKEGYTIDLYDFVSPSITHEKIFLALVLLAIILGLRWHRGG